MLMTDLASRNAAQVLLPPEDGLPYLRAAGEHAARARLGDRRATA